MKEHMLRPLLGAVCILTGLSALNIAVSAEDSPLTLRGVQDQIADLKEQVDDLAKQQDSLAQGLQIRAFADVSYHAERGRRDDGSRSADNYFQIGAFDLFLTKKLDDRFSVLSEIILEGGPDGLVVDFERMLVRYDLDGSLQFSVGRLHTSITYWNEAFHHGEWMSTSIGRPRAVDFEDGDGLLPSHVIGLQMKGNRDLGALRIDYALELGNGRGPTSDPPQTTSDANASKALNLQMAVSPFTTVPGLRLGLGWYLDRIPASTDPALLHGEISEQIWSGFMVYKSKRWEASAELARSRRPLAKDNTPGFDRGDRAVSYGGVAQLACHFNTLTPYLRFDTVRMSTDDRYFSNTDSQNTYAVGLRWDVQTFVALKLQLEHTELKAGDAISNPGSSTLDGSSQAVRLQVSVAL